MAPANAPSCAGQNKDVINCASLFWPEITSVLNHLSDCLLSGFQVPILPPAEAGFGYGPAGMSLRNGCHTFILVASM